MVTIRHVCIISINANHTCIGTATSAAMKAMPPRKALLEATAEDERPLLASTIYARVLEYIQLINTILLVSRTLRTKGDTHMEKKPAMNRKTQIAPTLTCCSQTQPYAIMDGGRKGMNQNVLRKRICNGRSCQGADWVLNLKINVGQ